MLTATRFRATASMRALMGAGLGSGPGLLLPFAVAFTLGVGHLTDAYFFAFSFCLFAMSIVENTVNANAVTVFAAARRSGQAAFVDALRRTSAGCIATALALYTVVAVVGTLFVYANGNWGSTVKADAALGIWILGVLVAFAALSSVLTAALYSGASFFAAPATVAFRSLAALASLPIAAMYGHAILVLAVSLSIGEGLRSFWLARLVRREYIPLGAPSGGDAKVPGLIGPSIPYAMSIAVSSAAPVIDRGIASTLGEGSVTTIDLAERIFYIPMTIVWSSVVVVAGARWSARYAEGDITSLRTDFIATSRRALTLSAAAAVVIGAVLGASTFVVGDTIAGTSTERLLVCALIMLMGLPAGAVAALGGRYLSAARRTSVLPLFSLSALAITTVGAIVGSQVAGIYGIAAATTLARLTIAVAFYRVCTTKTQNR